MSIDKLQDLIRKKKNPTVAGLDPRPDYIPPHILDAAIHEKGETLEALADAFLTFNKGLIDALADVVPAVKPQSACYELLGPAGAVALAETIRYAKEKGLYVILDVKRGDIGSTAQAYSQAYLGRVPFKGRLLPAYDADSMTVNAYLGSDGILPFLQDCQTYDKSIFTLVKTSNPSSGELQDLITGDRNLYTAVGDLMARISRETIGKYGFSSVGAVVGATYPSDMRTLRKRLENTFFLVPGYGAQGGGAEDVAPAFNKYGYGAIVNSSRGILCAWQKDGAGESFGAAARTAAIEMREDLRRVVTVV